MINDADKVLVGYLCDALKKMAEAEAALYKNIHEIDDVDVRDKKSIERFLAVSVNERMAKQNAYIEKLAILRIAMVKLKDKIFSIKACW